MATKLVPQPLDLDEVALTELSHTIWMPGRLAGMPGLLVEDVCKELQAASHSCSQHIQCGTNWPSA